MVKHMLIFALLVLTLSLDSCKAQDNSDTTRQKFPKATGWVNDFEDIFTEDQEENLEKLIKELNSAASIQIALVTLDSFYTSLDSFDQYTLDLANYWRVGEKVKDNGILIAICNGYRRIRIHNGYGIEKIISDEETKTILDQYFIPDFKQGRYYEGTVAGLQGLTELLGTKKK
ncbi:MAG: TPM domain-containing protein [Taibaiella sp.]|nr:TPM domain-containing protein [Taibaiella sp.]